MDLGDLENPEVRNGLYSISDHVVVKAIGFNYGITYSGCCICRKRLTADVDGQYVCPSHKFKKNPTPCYKLRLLLHDISSDAELWCVCFHDLTTRLMGLNVRDYESLSNEDAQYHALDGLRGAIMRATIRKSVSASYTNFVMTDGVVLFTQKDMETSTEMTDDITTVVPGEGSSEQKDMEAAVETTGNIKTVGRGKDSSD